MTLHTNVTDKQQTTLDMLEWFSYRVAPAQLSYFQNLFSNAWYIAVFGSYYMQPQVIVFV